MESAIKKLRSQVGAVSDKYTSGSKRKELDEIFDVLEKELTGRHVQSQRIMALLRAVMARQPGSSKAINEFLQNEKISNLMHRGGLSL